LKVVKSLSAIQYLEQDGGQHDESEGPMQHGFGKTVGGIDDQVNIPAFVERLALTILIVDSLSCS
jgi:hypothetical protein